MRKFQKDINVLGSVYKIYTDNREGDSLLNRCDGYMTGESKTIIINEEDVPKHQERVLAHECVHAFLYESGLDVETWANNEEIVDWIALQHEKLFKTIREAKTCIVKKKEKQNDE